MKRSLAILLSLALLTTGCSHIRYVDLTYEKAALDEINRSLKGRYATVYLKDGTPIPVKHVSLGTECTLLILRNPVSTDTTLPTWRIDRIERTSRARGALGGGLTGLVVGFLVGALLGGGSYSEEDSNFIVTSRTDAAILGAIYLGAIGLATGALVGGLAGTQDTYDVWGAAYSDSCKKGKH